MSGLSKQRYDLDMSTAQMTFSEEKLKEAANRAAFEMYYFRYYAHLYREDPQQKDLTKAFGAVVRGAVENSLLLHLRILLEFFYTDPGPPKRDHNDCWVGHFIELDAFRAGFPKPPDKSPWYAELKRTLDKWLVHFTASRWEDVHREMDYYAQYFGAINSLIDKFEVALPQELKRAFTKRIQEFERRDGTGVWHSLGSDPTGAPS